MKSFFIYPNPYKIYYVVRFFAFTEFFDITKDSKKLFEDTFIMKTEYASELNQYPTIFISFADAKGDVTNMIRQIKVQLQNEYDRLKDVFIDLTEFEENDYHKIKADLMDNDNGKLNSTVFEFKYIKSNNDVSKEQLSEIAKQAVDQIKNMVQDYMIKLFM